MLPSCGSKTPTTRGRDNTHLSPTSYDPSPVSWQAWETHDAGQPPTPPVVLFGVKPLSFRMCSGPGVRRIPYQFSNPEIFGFGVVLNNWEEWFWWPCWYTIHSATGDMKDKPGIVYTHRRAWYNVRIIKIGWTVSQEWMIKKSLIVYDYRVVNYNNNTLFWWEFFYYHTQKLWT